MNNYVLGCSWSTRLTCKNGKCKLLGCIHVVSTYVYSTLWTYVTHASEVKFIKQFSGHELPSASCTLNGYVRMQYLQSVLVVP